MMQSSTWKYANMTVEIVKNSITNKKYPGCNVNNPMFIGNEVCDSEEYNTTECGYDGGDCLN